MDYGTAAAESAAICMVAGTTRLAASAIVRGRASEQRLADHELTLARLDERDRIAESIRTHAVRQLFDITLTLEAAKQGPPERAAAKIEAAVATLDQVCAEMRSSVFRSPADASGPGGP